MQFIFLFTAQGKLQTHNRKKLDKCEECEANLASLTCSDCGMCKYFNAVYESQLKLTSTCLLIISFFN